MINAQNITAFINYLHQQRTGQNASNELLQKWSTLSNVEIDVQLKNLYQHWNLSEASAQTHVNNFIQFTNPTQHQPVLNNANNYSTNTQSNNVFEAPPKSYFVPALIGVLITAAAVFGYYYWQNNKSNTVSPTATTVTNTPPAYVPPIAEPTNTVTPSAPKPIEDSAKKATTNSSVTLPDTKPNLQITQTDKTNIQNLSNLFEAEQSRNFEDIYQYFSPDITQYWDITYPTRTELEERYQAMWQKSSDGKNLDMKVSKIGEKKYRVTGAYEYFSIKNQETKTVPVNTIFTFNNDGKIVYENNGK